MIATANPVPSSAAASLHAATSPSPELLEARRARDDLTTLLRHEQVAMADFLVALSDFDRRRGWELLGHASLFAFLHVELKLPNPSAFWRMSAARLLQRFPDLAAPLRDGRLCCTATAELAKVLTEQNLAEVLPRFFGLSSREAQEIVAELHPRQAPATRTVVTAPARVAAAPALPLAVTSLSRGDATLARGDAALSRGGATIATAEAAAPGMHPNVVPPSQLRAPEVAFGGGVRAATLRDDVEPLETAEAAAPGMHPNVVPLSQLRAPEVAFGGGVRAATLRDDVEPLTAELRRLHITVDAQFLKMLATARDGLSHTIPRATAAPTHAGTSPPRSSAPSGSATAAAARGRSTPAAYAARRTGWRSTTSSRGRAGVARRWTSSDSSATPTTLWPRARPSATAA